MKMKSRLFFPWLMILIITILVYFIVINQKYLEEQHMVFYIADKDILIFNLSENDTQKISFQKDMILLNDDIFYYKYVAKFHNYQINFYSNNYTYLFSFETDRLQGINFISKENFENPISPNFEIIETENQKYLSKKVIPLNKILSIATTTHIKYQIFLKNTTIALIIFIIIWLLFLIIYSNQSKKMLQTPSIQEQ